MLFLMLAYEERNCKKKTEKFGLMVEKKLLQISIY